MIVFDTDIVTLYSYGKTEQLQRRIAAVAESEELAVDLLDVASPDKSGDRAVECFPDPVSGSPDTPAFPNAPEHERVAGRTFDLNHVDDHSA